MNIIEKLQSIPLDMITDPNIKNEIIELLDEYTKATDKSLFIKANADSTTILLDLIKEQFPNLIVDPKHPCFEIFNQQKQPAKQKSKKAPASKKNEKKEKPKPKPKSEKPKPKLSKAALIRKLEDLKGELADCKKRNPIPQVPKAAYTRLNTHFHAIIRLIPDHIKNNPTKLKRVKTSIIGIHQKVIKTYEMDIHIAEASKTNLLEKFDTLIAKIT